MADNTTFETFFDHVFNTLEVENDKQVKKPLSSQSPEILIPAYFYPYDDSTDDLSSDLYKMAELSNKYSYEITTSIILNPEDGPGHVQDGVFTESIEKLHASDARVIGYIDTRYTNKDVSLVKSEIDIWYSWYKIDGIFLDEFPYDYNDSLVTYYKAVSDYIRRHDSNAYIIVNPGTTCNYQWFSIDLFDLCCIWETNVYLTLDDAYSYEYRDIDKNKKSCIVV